ncbi:hypothetical protein, partial [Streptomyces virginiae]
MDGSHCSDREAELMLVMRRDELIAEGRAAVVGSPRSATSTSATPDDQASRRNAWKIGVMPPSSRGYEP